MEGSEERFFLPGDGFGVWVRVSVKVNVHVHVEESAAADVVTASLTLSHVFASLPVAASGTVSSPALSSAEPIGKNRFICLLYVELTHVTNVRT